MKIAVILLALFSRGAQDEFDIDRLVENLSDPAIDVRENAEWKLIRLGDSIITELEARAEGADEEVRARLEQVILLIRREKRERRFNPGPARITLSLQNADIRGVLESIGKQVRSETRLRYEGNPHPVSVDFSECPLFEAIDLICRKDGGLDWSVKVSTPGAEILVRQARYVPFPRVIRDQFMIWVEGVHLDDRMDFGRGRKQSGGITVRAVWEPDTIPKEVSFRLTALDDEKGNSLMGLVQQIRAFPRKSVNAAFLHTIRFVTLPPKGVKAFSRIEGELVPVFPVDSDVIRFPTSELRAGSKGSASTFQAEILSVERDRGDVHMKVKIEGSPRRERPTMILVLEGGDEISARVTGTRIMFSQGRTSQTYDVAFAFKPEQEVASLEMSLFKGRREKVIPVEFRDVRFRP